jgi:hypothetical protein
MAQVHVDVVHLAVVDLLAGNRIGLEGQRSAMPSTLASAPSNSGAVEAPVSTFTWNGWPAAWACSMRGQRQRHRLGVARAGEAAHRDGFAGLDQGRSLFGRSQLRQQAGMVDAFVGHGVGRWHGIAIIAQCSMVGDSTKVECRTGRFRRMSVYPIGTRRAWIRAGSAICLSARGFSRPRAQCRHGAIDGYVGGGHPLAAMIHRGAVAVPARRRRLPAMQAATPAADCAAARHPDGACLPPYIRAGCASASVFR